MFKKQYVFPTILIATSLISLISCNSEENKYSITYNYDSSMGKVEGPSFGRAGEVIEFSVTPFDGYKIKNVSNSLLIESNLYSYTVNKESNVIDIDFTKISNSSIVIYSLETSILQSIEFTPEYYGDITSKDLSFSYEGYEGYFKIEKIEDNTYSLTGLKECSNINVLAKNSEEITTKFNVSIKSSEYKEVDAATSENWFNNISVDSLSSSLNTSMPLGIDASFVKQIYDVGGHFYNSEGKEEPIFKILKDNGCNAIRIKEFVDPYNYNNLDNNGDPITYGGGINDNSTNLWIAKYASLYGLDICIDFHYSDFYADPSDQVLPKAWKDVSSSDELAQKVYDYTYESLNNYKENGINIKYCQIGNELTSGILLHYPGSDLDELTNSKPGYITKKTKFSYAGNVGSDNFVKYLTNGCNASKAVFPSIQNIIHIARGFSAGTDYFTNYYKAISSVDYDIIGLSSYIFYQGNPTGNNSLETIATSLKEAFPSKKIMVAETSYGYTLTGNSNATNTFNSDNVKSSYEVSPLGQAKLIRDQINVINNLGDQAGGLFYWGGDMIPVNGYGWADSSTKSTWANQALFSYGGKALPSLNVFNKIKQ